ncbi:MAG: hypothetical protein AB1847_10170 [bacterium]
MDKAGVTRVTTRSAYLLLVFSLGITAVFWWYNTVQLTRQRDMLQKELRTAEKKTDLLKKKKAEESQVIQAQQLRERSSLVAQIQTAEARVAAFQKEKSLIMQEYESLLEQKNKLEHELQILACRMEEVIESWKNNKKELAGLTAMHEKAKQDLMQLAEEKQNMKKTLESEVEKVRQKLGQCEAHNARLCAIADELINKYQTKGLVNTLLQKEPFTQIRRVEVDELMQEYHDKIEQQKLHGASGKAGSASSSLPQSR